MTSANTPLRIAIVGCGDISEIHARVVSEHPDAELTAGVDPRLAARRRFTGAWGRPGYRSLAELHAKADFDAAIVAVPTGLHREVCGDLLRRGTDVLCEAPLASGSAEARELYGRARDLELVLMTASAYRYLPELAEVRGLLRDGVVGRPLLFEVLLCSRRPVAKTWRADPELSGGGVLVDLGVHALDILFEVLDAPITGLTAAFSPRSVTMDVEDTAEVQLRTGVGTLGRAALSWCYDAPDPAFLTIQGSKGTVRVSSEGVRYRRHGRKRWNTASPGWDGTSARGRQMAAFVERVGTRQEPAGIPVPVQALELIERAYESERDGGWSWRLYQQAGLRAL